MYRAVFALMVRAASSGGEIWAQAFWRNKHLESHQITDMSRVQRLLWNSSLSSWLQLQGKKDGRNLKKSHRGGKPLPGRTDITCMFRVLVELCLARLFTTKVFISPPATFSLFRGLGFGLGHATSTISGEVRDFSISGCVSIQGLHPSKASPSERPC